MGPYEAVLAPHVPSFGERLYLREFRPHLVVFPYFLYPAHIARARYLQEQGIGVAVLPTEGTSLIEEVRLQIAGKFVDLSPVDLFFIWNQDIAGLVRAHKTIALEQCIVAGVPRFDFYHPRFRQLLMSKEDFCARYAMDPRRQVITWATNHDLVRFAGKPADTANLIQRYRAAGLTQSPFLRDIPRLIEQEVESRQVLTRSVLSLAKRFAESYLVIKVHPAEEIDWYQEQVASAGLNNVRVVFREYIWNVLNATAIHLHRSCTTGIEAWLLDKPTVDLQFTPGGRHFFKEIASGSDVACSPEECASYVQHYLDHGLIAQEQRSARPGIIEWFCGKVDGQSAWRHADAIHAWLEGSEKEPEAPKWSWEDCRLALTSHMKALLGFQPYESVRTWVSGHAQDTRGKYFTLEDTRKWVLDIQRILDGSAL